MKDPGLLKYLLCSIGSCSFLEVVSLSEGPLWMLCGEWKRNGWPQLHPILSQQTTPPPMLFLLLHFLIQGFLPLGFLQDLTIVCHVLFLKIYLKQVHAAIMHLLHSWGQRSLLSTVSVLLWWPFWPQLAFIQCVPWWFYLLHHVVGCKTPGVVDPRHWVYCTRSPSGVTLLNDRSATPGNSPLLWLGNHCTVGFEYISIEHISIRQTHWCFDLYRLEDRLCTMDHLSLDS